MTEPPFVGRYRASPTSAMRRPRACLASKLPGGLGQPSGPTTGVCLQWLDGRGRRRAKACRIRRAKSPPSADGSTAPRTEIAAVERREAPASPATEARQDGRLVRRSVLHSLGVRGRKRGRPAYPAPQTTGAIPHGCLKIECARPQSCRPCW